MSEHNYDSTRDAYQSDQQPAPPLPKPTDPRAAYQRESERMIRLQHDQTARAALKNQGAGSEYLNQMPKRKRN